MAPCTKASGRMGNQVVTEDSSMPMVTYMLEIGLATRQMAAAATNTSTVNFMKECGRMTSNMDMA